MPRVCTVCNHSQTYEIDRLLAKGQSYSGIARQFGLGEDSVTRHVQNCLAHCIAAARAEHGKERGIIVEKEIDKVFTFLGKLLSACDEWLTDPEDPTKYCLDARAAELDVVYYDHSDLTDRGKPKRKRAHLSDLLRRLEESARVDPVSALIKRADPRDVIVRTAGEIKNQLELLARLQGLFQRDRANESDRQHDRDIAENVRAEVQRLIDEGWTEADARAIVIEAEPLASQWLQ